MELMSVGHAGPPCHRSCGMANIKIGRWSPEEDAQLKAYILQHGVEEWMSLPRKIGLNRCGKSCRLRWLNYLRPGLNLGPFSEEEDRIIFNLYSLFGSRWSTIARHLPGRTDNHIKNYWNLRLKKTSTGKQIDQLRSTGQEMNIIQPKIEPFDQNDYPGYHKPALAYPQIPASMQGMETDMNSMYYGLPPIIKAEPVVSNMQEGFGDLSLDYFSLTDLDCFEEPTDVKPSFLLSDLYCFDEPTDVKHSFLLSDLDCFEDGMHSFLPSDLDCFEEPAYVKESTKLLADNVFRGSSSSCSWEAPLQSDFNHDQCEIL